MKKNLLFVCTIISGLYLIGCSRFEDTTSVGSSVIDGIDSSTLNFSKHILPFELNTSIVSSQSSIPDNDDTCFGVHSGSVFPVGGKNGEVATAYYEFKTSFDNWKKISGVDSLADLVKINSTELIFYKDDSTNAICNYNQNIEIINVKDSTYKYNRNQKNVEKILSDTLNNKLYHLQLDTTDLKNEFVDDSLSKQILETCTMQHQRYSKMPSDSQTIFEDSIFKPQTFRFVLVSKEPNSNLALLKYSASLKVHMRTGEKNYGHTYKHDTTITIDTVIKPISQKIQVRDPKIYISDTIEVHYNTNVGDTLLDTLTFFTSPDTAFSKQYPIFRVSSAEKRFRLNSGDSTKVIDSTMKICDTLIIDSMSTEVFINNIRSLTLVDSIIDSTRINADSVRYTCSVTPIKLDSLFKKTTITKEILYKKGLHLSIDTTVMKADSFYIPLSHSNYAVYEKSDTLANRQTTTMSSFGPQRTAVFALNVDSLRKKLTEPATASQPAFNKILSAGVAITGTYAPEFQANMTDLSDTTISVRWFISEYPYDKYPYNNGVEIYKKDKTLGRNDEVKPGQEVVLPVEKNLQEILSRSATLPSTVYLYLEILSSKHYNKQVIWSKPSLLTFLTTSK